MKLISIVIPVYNEVRNIPLIYEEIIALSLRMSHYQFEIVISDNHSMDGSFEVASELATKDPKVKVVRLSRNFGFQANILTGLRYCTGDAAVQLDADGEDDPRLIEEFIKHWDSGFKVVYGIRKTRRESAWLTFQRKCFYRLLGYLSSYSIPIDAGDFRLIDRQVLDALLSFKEANPYLRGLIAYSGFNQVGIPYNRRKRYFGESKFRWWDYFSLALDGITSFSRKPLTLATWVGLAFASLSFTSAIFYLLKHLLWGVQIAGFTTTILVHLFLAGVQLVCIGLLGTYLGRVFDEVKGRPLSLVEQVVSLKKTEAS